MVGQPCQLFFSLWSAGRKTNGDIWNWSAWYWIYEKAIQITEEGMASVGENKEASAEEKKWLAWMRLKMQHYEEFLDSVKDDKSGMIHHVKNQTLEKLEDECYSANINIGPISSGKFVLAGTPEIQQMRKDKDFAPLTGKYSDLAKAF